jgi:hypothetical protein
MIADKVAWIIGKLPVDQQKIRERGYSIREFDQQTVPQQYIDDQPDLIIFSESGVKDFSIFFKMKYFYPDTIILTVPDQAPPKSKPAENHDQYRTGDSLSISRLLNAIRKIEGQ